MSFGDHFSRQASGYRRYRPGYPPALFAWLASRSPGRDRALDVGAGNGQASGQLAQVFGSVVALEPSAAQLTHREPTDGVAFVRGQGETMPVRDASFDLLLVAQAIHWFDRPAFWGEAGRVLRPGGLVALISYGIATVDPGVDGVLGRVREAVREYWPAGREHVDDGYRSLQIPFPEIDPGSWWLEAHWTVEELEGYVSTWSARQRYVAARGEDPLEPHRASLAVAWGGPTRRVRWPLAVRVARVG